MYIFFINKLFIIFSKQNNHIFFRTYIYRCCQYAILHCMLNEINNLFHSEYILILLKNLQTSSSSTHQTFFQSTAERRPHPSLVRFCAINASFQAYLNHADQAGWYRVFEQSLDLVLALLVSLSHFLRHPRDSMGLGQIYF